MSVNIPLMVGRVCELTLKSGRVCEHTLKSGRVCEHTLKSGRVCEHTPVRLTYLPSAGGCVSDPTNVLSTTVHM